ncbi:unnamed protein product [Adineta ricciae]|uniref:Uncharacterized protein n=1 Tax=Adineta ricciae TaxID=249248 RepID=A0A814ZPV1_ADIRI|nr:unnamed protein product [Adineta ricciae]CAF1246908.1 unnamed protein product [Adineta ricciae]
MSSDRILTFILGFSVFGTFFGHGCLATRFVPSWLPYLRVIGVGDKWARILMPVIGFMDIIIGFFCLFSPTYPLVYCWAFVWGVATAMMRPLAGESIFGLVERTGNFCPALALLWLNSGRHFGFYLNVCAIMAGTLVVSGVILRSTALLKK